VAWAERLPEVAVTVREDAPAAAVAAAVNFNVLPVNAAVTPVGRPATASVGLPLKPFTGVTVSVLVPDAPCVTLMLAGDAARVKLGTALMVRLKVVAADEVPDVPLTVIVVVPIAATGVAVNVATLVVDVDVGLNETLTPVGSVEVVSVTLPVKPLLGVTVIVLVPVPL
jgi:hypothetical protein